MTNHKENLNDESIAQLERGHKIGRLYVSGTSHLSGIALLKLTDMIINGHIGEVVVTNAKSHNLGEGIGWHSNLTSDIALTPYPLVQDMSSQAYSDFHDLQNLATSAARYRNNSAQHPYHATQEETGNLEKEDRAAPRVSALKFKLENEARRNYREAKSVLLHSMLAITVDNHTNANDWIAKWKMGGIVGGINYIKSAEGYANHPRISYSRHLGGFKVPVAEGFDAKEIAKRLRISEDAIDHVRSPEGQSYVVVPEKELDRILGVRHTSLTDDRGPQRV